MQMPYAQTPSPSPRRSLAARLGFAAAATLAVAIAAGQSAPVPRVQQPPSIVADVKRLENQFELALAQDCPAERCFSRGCTYLSHETVDKPKSGSLPGIGDPGAGPGSAGPAQEFLTGARCEFGYESSLAAKDVAALNKRLEQRLSRGYLVVGVESKTLPAVPNGLKQNGTSVPAAGETEEAAQAPPPWNGALAARELWLHLLPHFSWMLAIVLLTAACVVLIWAARRLGKETLPLADEELPKLSPDSDLEPAQEGLSTKPGQVNTPFDPEASRTEWLQRLESDPAALRHVCGDWLKEGRNDMLAKAMLLFRQAAAEILPQGAQDAPERLAFASYMKALDPLTLPDDASFFRALERHAIAASIAHRDDTAAFALLRNAFGPAGIAELIASLGNGAAATLFALSPDDCRSETASLLPPAARIALASRLVDSDRASSAEMNEVMQKLQASGRSTHGSREISDQTQAQSHSQALGRVLPAARALSALLPLLAAKERTALLERARTRGEGAFPTWLNGIFYPEMLRGLPQELRQGLYLQIDPRDLFLWLERIRPETKDAIRKDLPSSLLTVVQSQSQGALTRDEAAQIARKVDGRLRDLLEREFSAGRAKLDALVAAA